MEWTGSWKNQYGSELVITSEVNGRLSGTFRTALDDSGFYGQTHDVKGITAGDMPASFSGILLGDRMETMWFVVVHAADKQQPWPHAVSMNHDTFTRVGAR